jgi:hypothetical protein
VGDWSSDVCSSDLSLSLLLFLSRRHLTLEYVGKDIQKCMNFI